MPAPSGPSDLDRFLAISLGIDGNSPIERALKIAEALHDAPAKAALLPRVGDMRGAITAHREAMADPRIHRVVLESLIQMLDRENDTTPEEAAAVRQDWWRAYGMSRPIAPYPNTRDPERPLRVGYVSSNFKHSSAGNCLEAVVLSHSDAVVPICYMTSPPSDWDPATWTFQARTTFVDVSGLSEAAFAQRVHDDEVDLLIDCMGFTYGNRLRAFAEHPAPLQFTGWGYATGTIHAMDGILLDPITAGNDQFSERVLHLPCVITYAAPVLGPPVAPAPTGPVTFGAFHCFIKINPDVLTVWRQILDRVPESRIVFKGKEYGEAALRERITNVLGAERCEFWPQTQHLAHLDSFRHIDLVLDPFPQTGGITTCEALHMGVPSVTWLGPRTIHRAAASILDAVGFQQGIATTQTQYIARAVDLVTTQRAWLSEQRPYWRQRLAESRVVKGYVAAAEAVFRHAWRQWCAQEQA